jgi:hypothetical protein
MGLAWQFIVPGTATVRSSVVDRSCGTSRSWPQRGACRRRDVSGCWSRRERCCLSCAFVYGANRSGTAASWFTGWPVTRERGLVPYQAALAL